MLEDEKEFGILNEVIAGHGGPELDSSSSLSHLKSKVSVRTRLTDDAGG